MKRLSWQSWLAIFLVILSILLYIFHFFIFRDPHHIFIYMVGDLAFLPIEVLLVTLIIHQLLSQREKRRMLEKLNMVIETFFSEVGIDLLKFFIKYDRRIDEVGNQLIINASWTDHDFLRTKRILEGFEHNISCPRDDFTELRTFLISKRTFLLRLLENPILLEHESFTDTLRAVFHLIEELSHRHQLGDVCDKDFEHIKGDMKRAYGFLIGQWLEYMRYLKNNYPYLFSLASRVNPFDPTASVEIK